jgi:hypothetical protein
MVAPTGPDGVRGPHPHGRVSFRWQSIIQRITQTIQRDPSEPDQIDAEHQATDLAVKPWRVLAAAAPCGPVLPGRTSGVAVDGCAAGCPAWRCRRVCMTLPPSRVSAAPAPTGCRRPPAASTVQAPGPSLSAGCADLAWNPRQVSVEPDTAAASAVRLECGRCWPDGHCPLEAAAASLSRAGAWWSPVADHPCTPADCGSGNRPPPADTAATWRCGPNGWMVARGAGVRSAADLDASLRCSPLRPEPRPVPDRRCPPGTLPQAADIGCYRNRSPARRPLEGCRHRR